MSGVHARARKSYVIQEVSTKKYNAGDTAQSPNQGVSKVTRAVFHSRESENFHQLSGLYPKYKMAEERFNVGVLRISEMPSGPGVRTIEKPIKDTYHTSVLFTVKP